MVYRLNQFGKMAVKTFILQNHKDADALLDYADGRFERAMETYIKLAQDKATETKQWRLNAPRCYFILNGGDTGAGISATLQLTFKDHFK